MPTLEPLDFDGEIKRLSPLLAGLFHILSVLLTLGMLVLFSLLLPNPVMFWLQAIMVNLALLLVAPPIGIIVIGVEIFFVTLLYVSASFYALLICKPLLIIKIKMSKPVV